MANQTIPKISVTIITYNQENMIGRALDSILVQKEWVHEIIICDDCSKDGNWNVILDYAQKHPDLIKPYRNSTNLGIFGNIENTWNKTTGDAVILVSGDDALCNGLFKEAVRLIESNNINYKDELFCLYFDYKVKYPTKKLNIVNSILNKPSNKLIAKGYDPISLKIRVLVVNRTIIFSNKIQQNFKPIPKNIGIFADGIFDIQVQELSEKNYYSPFVGSVYYAKIGVSVKTNLIDSITSKIRLMEEYEKKFILSEKDKAWINYIKYKNYFFLNPSLKQLIKATGFYIKSINFKYGIRGLRLKMFFMDSILFLNMHILKNE